jgi:hypothetical protein
MARDDRDLADAPSEAKPTISLLSSEDIGPVLLRTFDYFGMRRYLWEMPVGRELILVALLSQNELVIGYAVNDLSADRRQEFLVEFTQSFEDPGDPSLWELMDPTTVLNATRSSSPTTVSGTEIGWKPARDFWAAKRAARLIVPKEERIKFPITSSTIAQFKLEDYFCRNTWSIISTHACFFKKLCDWAQCIDEAIALEGDAAECGSHIDEARACIGDYY